MSPATRVIALAHVDKNDAPEEINQIDPDILVEVVLMGIIPDSEENRGRVHDSRRSTPKHFLANNNSTQTVFGSRQNEVNH